MSIREKAIEEMSVEEIVNTDGQVMVSDEDMMAEHRGCTRVSMDRAHTGEVVDFEEYKAHFVY